jgi:hypothetical protein
MASWKILDKNGNTLLSQFGSGASLTDPVTVAHGGTGLITVVQGDLLYCSADGVISRLAKDASGTRILTNLGSNNNPKWSDPSSSLGSIPNPTTRKFGFSESLGGTSFNNYAIAQAVNASTGVTDASSHWSRYTTGNVSGNQAGYRFSADWAWLDHLPKINAHIRTGSTVAAVRIMLFLSNVGGALISNADDQHLLKGVGIRYSSPFPDSGWVGWTSDGTTQTIGSLITTIAASTVYNVVIEVTSTTSVTFTVNGSTQTMSVPSGALGTAMRLNLQVTTTAAVVKDLDISAVYGEWN